MILILLIAIPLIAGVLAWLCSRWSEPLARWVCLGAMALDLALLVGIWLTPAGSSATWIASTRFPWIPQLGVSFHLAIDGLSLVMALLTAFMGLAAVACSWREITDRVGLFHFNLMLVLAGIMGVFLALDLFLFYFFWELMLVPMFFLIRVWGHDNRIYASLKFFLFTQAGGLLLLLGIIGLSCLHHHQTGVLTFDYEQLLGTSTASTMGMWLMLAFVAAFAVKLPVVGLHTWLADAHTEAPTAGSVVLAGLLLKTGAYGFLRLALGLFPEASRDFAPIGMTLGVIGILYGAVLAFAQKDLKRLVAYTSVSHMGFVLLGVYAGTQAALQGAVLQIVCHGVSTGALFILVGLLYERIRTRDLSRMGGLWSVAPTLGGIWLFFALAAMGLPGLGNFVGEFLILIGTFKVSVALAAIAACGMVASVIYALWMFQSVFQGPNLEGWPAMKLRPREYIIQAALIAVIVWLGVFPKPVMRIVQPALDRMEKRMQPPDEKPLIIEVSAPIESDGRGGGL